MRIVSYNKHDMYVRHLLDSQTLIMFEFNTKVLDGTMPLVPLYTICPCASQQLSPKNNDSKAIIYLKFIQRKSFTKEKMKKAKKFKSILKKSCAASTPHKPSLTPPSFVIAWSIPASQEPVCLPLISCSSRESGSFSAV